MGGSGFSLGAMAGKLLADQIDLDFIYGEKRTMLPEIEKLNPNRFNVEWFMKSKAGNQENRNGIGPFTETLFI